tara:strand:- start:333 stop:608 length:276 start_codon:yes stop_codon:yes gene_type:complete
LSLLGNLKPVFVFKGLVFGLDELSELLVKLCLKVLLLLVVWLEVFPLKFFEVILLLLFVTFLASLGQERGSLFHYLVLGVLLDIRVLVRVA